MTAMRRVSAVGLCLLAWGCASDSNPGTTRTYDIHSFSPAERMALAAALSRSLPNPAAAQFKWMPALVGAKGQPTQYCGLIGTNAGFRKFAASIARNGDGVFDRGAIQHIEGGAFGVADAPGGTAALCGEWGYSDFALAN